MICLIVINNVRLRAAIKAVIPFAAVPAVAAVGSVADGGRRYTAAILAAAVLALLLFAAGYEKRQTGSRRLVIAAVMTALCVAGRFIPFFKPVTALTVITAMYLGSETGFLIGAMSAALSNIYFGQGPWTPFQMLAWGLVGLAAGYLSGPLKRSRAFLLFYGVFSGIAFSFIMDIWTVLWYSGSFNAKLYTAAIISALPHTALYAVSNFLFLWFLADPIGQKLERVRIKYGI